MMPKRVFIIHGFNARPDLHWFPWLKSELEKIGFEAAVPAMPTPNTPTEEGWVSAIRGAVGELDEHTYLVGHSLGVTAILRYLESLPENKKIGGAVLVSGLTRRIRYKPLASFFTKEFNYDRIKKSCKKFVVVHSKDDTHVSFEKHALFARDTLGAELIALAHGDHFGAEDGFTMFPEVFEAVKKIASMP